MRVLLVGEPATGLLVTGSFARALHKLNISHSVFDERPYLKVGQTNRWTALAWRIFYRLNRRRPPAYWRYNRDLLNMAGSYQPDLVLTFKGPFINPRTVSAIQAETGARVVTFLTDDPFNPANTTPDLAANLARYDVLFTPRRANIESEQAGAKRVYYLPFGWDPDVFFPETSADAHELEAYRSDVVFVGNCDRDRLPVLKMLLDAASNEGWRFALYGANISRYPSLRGVGHGVVAGRDYRLALGGAKIALCLLRHANRDLTYHVRTFEIAGCGAFMLAERTVDHLELLGEDEGAAMFSSAAEMLDKVRYYLMHSAERQKIAAEGRRRIVTGGHTYAHRLQTILDTIT